MEKKLDIRSFSVKEKVWVVIDPLTEEAFSEPRRYNIVHVGLPVSDGTRYYKYLIPGEEITEDVVIEWVKKYSSSNVPFGRYVESYLAPESNIDRLINGRD